MSLQHYIPYAVDTKTDELLFHWLPRKDIAFDAPFFDETIALCKRLPEFNYRIKSTCTAEMLQQWASQAKTTTPAAFIFHVSRCGSTLLSQLFAQDPAHIVLSEVPLIDALLTLSHVSLRPDAAALVPSVLALLGQQQTGAEEKLFVKLDSWHLCFYDTLRASFPHTPFILLYREPAAVLRSQQQKRGLHAVPGLVPDAVFGWEADPEEPFSLDGHLGKVLATYFDRILDIHVRDANSLLLNYASGNMELLEQTCAFSGTVLSEAVREKAYERQRYHGKFPGQAFVKDAVLEEVPAFLEAAMNGYAEVEKRRG